MQITTMGIVLKEVKTGEADRILTILTEKLGIVSASAKNSLSLKSKLVSSTALFSYSEFVLYQGKTMYSINSADSVSIFHGINESIEALALSMYIAELTCACIAAEQEAGEQLPLLLNTFYCISKQKYPLKLIKAVYELRTIANIGFMPSLIACDECAKYQGGGFFFDYEDGIILCESCAEKQNKQVNISPSVLAAMRHIIFCEPKKIFSFTLNEQSTDLLYQVSQHYTLGKLDRNIKTLDFLNDVIQ